VLHSIAIQNYKGITPDGVALRDLAAVNYFVGENGSGKSSVLHYIFTEQRAQAVCVTDSFTDGDVFADMRWGASVEETYQHLLGLHIVCLDVVALARQNRVSPTILDVEVLELAQRAIETLFGAEKVPFSAHCDIQPDEEKISAGENKLIHIVYAVLLAQKMWGVQYVCIDSPSNHLHPRLQKDIPQLLDFIARTYTVQVFLTTHSPFVMSAAAPYPDQRAYFLKEGKIAGKHGQISTKGSSGYGGNKIVQIAAGMLGAGFADIYSPQLALRTPNSPIVILCEGEGQQEDAVIYNTIFHDHIPRLLFASSRGSSQLEKSFTILRDITPALSVDFSLLMLRDRDHYFSDEEHIVRYEVEHPGAKVLRRRAIESYIFSEEVAELLCKRVGVIFSKTARVELKKMANLIQWEAEHGIVGNEYKQRSENTFTTHLTLPIGLWTRQTGVGIRQSLAMLITPESATYRELEGILGVGYRDDIVGG
jgi:ABC-type ATPase involved in cell division